LQPPPLDVSCIGSNVTCNGSGNGTVTAVTTGGTPAYSYHWSNGFTTSAINNLSAGTY
jgi:hypothetical protein